MNVTFYSFEGLEKPSGVFIIDGQFDKAVIASDDYDTNVAPTVVELFNAGSYMLSDLTAEIDNIGIIIWSEDV